MNKIVNIKLTTQPKEKYDWNYYFVGKVFKAREEKVDKLKLYVLLDESLSLINQVLTRKRYSAIASEKECVISSAQPSTIEQLKKCIPITAIREPKNVDEILARMYQEDEVKRIAHETYIARIKEKKKKAKERVKEVKDE